MTAGLSNRIIKSGASVLYMKVGRHAQESLAEIIARKQKEIDEEGYTLWGYGGNTCHPKSMVQPFAAAAAKSGRPIYLVMQEMESKHDKIPACSAEFSVDKNVWRPIPKGIEVRGSNYALAIRNLREADEELLLHQTKVAVGPSVDRLGHLYIGGHVDKACLEVVGEPAKVDHPEKHHKPIGLLAELIEPYAVFLRGARS
jgi:hypothetical protein